VVNRYLLGATECDSAGWIPDDHVRTGTGEARIRRVQVLGEDDEATGELSMDQDVRVRFQIEAFERVPDAHFEIGIYSEDGIAVAVTHRDIDHGITVLGSGAFIVHANVSIKLLPGKYRIGASIYRDSGYVIDGLERTVGFEVGRYSAMHARPYRWGEVRGFLRPPAEWVVERLTETDQMLTADKGKS
jgi:hypothetical protein